MRIERDPPTRYRSLIKPLLSTKPLFAVLFSVLMITSVFVGTITFAGTASAQEATGPSFEPGTLSGTNVDNPSSLQFGPDGRLYVAERFGTIHVLDVTRNGPGDYEVTDEETISSVKNLPNYDDDGTYNSGEDEREVTGLVVGGSADDPVLYVSSSDPRVGGGGDGTETGLDTNSGVISKLTPADGGGWNHEMLVRGLPRSEENHATNGLELSADGDTLYIAQGGNTNKGAPSNNFAYTPEYALSGAILELDLNQVAGMSEKDAANTDVPYRYDLPTIGDSPNQPFGGQDGANMAKLVQDGPVGVYSPGYRNPYDVTLTEDGQLYTFDNGPNSGWGGPPADESAGQCTNEPNEGNSYSTNDQLHLVTDGFYAGHANPTRGNPDGAGLYDENGEKTGSVAGAVYDGYDNGPECDYEDDGEDDSLTTISSSTNGIDEYSASNFDGAMQGDLLTAAFDGNVYRVELNDAGDSATDTSKQLSAGLGTPLDVTTQGDGNSFPGTVWVADFDGNDINVFEPSDYGGSDDGATCDVSDPQGDADDDGYTNEDEQAAGTDPCSAGSTPHDYDDDNVSDVTDSDDDNDGLSDTVDPFAVDAENGLATSLPVEYNFSRDSVAGSLEGIGFTGLMTNGQDYQDLYVPDDAVFGGASPILTQEVIKEGDAYEDTNTQQHAYQFGVNPPSDPFVVHAPVTGYPENPENYQSAGIQIGTGDQDNYLKLVVQANDGTGGVEMIKEVDGSATTVGQPDDPSVTGESTITDLDLTVYPSNDTVVGTYTVDDGEPTTVGSTTIPDSWLNNQVEGEDVGLATGVISTSNGASEFSATWQDFSVTKLDASDGGGNDGGTTSADVTVNENGDIDASTYSSGTMAITNTGETAISSATIDLSQSTLPDTVFDPEGSAGDSVGKDFTVDSGVGGGTTGSFAEPHNGQNGDDGYDVLDIEFADGEFEPGETLEFSTDIDPTSIKGAGGSGGAGSVSGLELSGSAVTVESADTTVENDLFTDGSEGGSQANAIADPADAPSLGVQNVALDDTDFPAHSAATVGEQEQTLTVNGPAGGTVDVLHVVADPVSDDAFDADPYEANKATEVETQTVDLGVDGEGTVDVTLTEGSLDYFTAAVENGDANGRTSDTVILELGEGTANQPPTADAGEDQTVDENTQVTLDGSGSSDSDGDKLGYSWTQTDGPDVQLSAQDTPKPTFTAPDVNEETTLTFEVEVADGNGGTDMDTVSVTVTPVDDAAPTISNFGLTNPEGQTLEVSFDSDEELADISVEITDGDGDTVATLGTDEFSSSEGTYTATYDADGPGTYTATLVTAADAADNDGANGQSDSATIGAPNSAPTAAFDYSPDEPTVGDEVTFDASGSSDTDGSIASYEWAFGDGTTASGETTSHTYDSAGEYDVTLTVTDDEGATDTTTQTVTVADEGAPALAVSPGSLDFGTVTVGQSETETVTVTNDGDAPMTVTQTSIAGPDGGEFTVLDNPAGDNADGESFTLGPGESQTVAVEFAPGSSGDKAATFIVNTENAGRETVSLSGTGDETGPQEHTLTIVGSGDRADYTFSVTSDDVEKSTANGANINGNDEVRRGYVGVGTVGISRDSYTYTGELETFGLDGDATVLVDGKELGDDVDDMRDNVIEIAGTGDASNYDFAATDGGKARLEKVTSNSANINGNDEIFRTTGNGQVGISKDAYGFDGVIDSLDLNGGDAEVYVNGKQVDPDDEQDNMITIVGTGEAANYEFTTSGGIAPSTANYANTNGNDVINGHTKTGQVGISADSNDYNGDIESFDVSGADVQVYVDGQQVDEDDVADEA